MSKVLRRAKWASQGKRYYLICTHITFSNILCGCCWDSICQMSTEKTNTKDSSTSRNIFLPAGKRNKIRKSPFLPVTCYCYMFYLGISHLIQNVFSPLTVIVLDYLISMNFFIIINIYFKYILWSLIIWQCAFLLG